MEGRKMTLMNVAEKGFGDWAGEGEAGGRTEKVALTCITLSRVKQIVSRNC